LIETKCTGMFIGISSKNDTNITGYSETCGVYSNNILQTKLGK